MAEEVRQQIVRFVETYSKKKNFPLNPDQEERDMVIDGLLANKESYGRQYCPCRPVEGIPEVDKKKICPCAWHIEEIERDGHCHCRLFFAPANG